MLYQDYRINSSYQQLSIVVSNTKNMQLWKKEPKNQLLFSDYIIDKILLQHWITAIAKKETILITEQVCSPSSPLPPNFTGEPAVSK